MRPALLLAALPALLSGCVGGLTATYERMVEYGTEESRVSKLEAASDPRLEEARREPDLERRAALLSAIVGDPKLAVDRAARAELVRTWARLGRLAEMESAAKELEIADDLEGAELLDAMAFALAEHGGDRDRALTLARRAVEVIDTLRVAGPPKGHSKGSWKRDLTLRKARYRDTVGWVLLKGGDERSAIDELEKAADVLPDDVEVHWHLGAALAEAGDREDAIEALAKAAAGGDADSPRALEALRKLDPAGADARVTAATEALSRRAAERARTSRIDEAAPPLASVPLEAGTPVVVLFWAAWDEDSLQALRALAALPPSPKYRVVSVSLDRAANGTAAAARLGVPFPVGLDPEGVDAAGWRVRALPTSVVLDARGRVRYRNEGMAPGYGWVLKAQVETIAGEGT